MKRFRKILSCFLVVVMLAGFLLMPSYTNAKSSLQPGDITGDGKVNVGDVSRLYSHIRGVKPITDVDTLNRADITGDGKINIGDTARIYAMVRSTVPNKTKVTLKVWAPGDDLVENGWIEQMEKAFEKAYPQYSITWINELCAEGDAGYMVAENPETAADVYFFANDQLQSLVSAGALASLEGDAQAQVKNDNSQTMVNTVTYTDGKIYGFPVSGNTWFMYYNKDVFTEEDVKSLDTMLTKGTVAFDWGNAWYGGTFFLANGGQIFGENGNDASAGIQFGKDNGGYEAALKMILLAEHPNMVDGGLGMGYTGFLDGSVDAFFSGTWDYSWLHEQMGDQLGAAQPPMVQIDGQQKQMKAFAGSKAVGVNPHADNITVSTQFAAFVSSVDAQKARYDLVGVVPAAETLADDPAICANVAAVAAINTVRNASVPQSYINAMNNYWTPVGSFGGMVASYQIDFWNYRSHVDQMMEWLNDYEVGEEPENPDEPMVPPEDGTPITLTVWTNSQDQMGNNSWLKQVEKQFQKEHPEYSITWVNGICTEGDAGYQVAMDPDHAADVYLFPNDQLETLKMANAITPLTGKYLEQVLADNSQATVNTVTFTDNQVYGFPVANNTWFMYYNKDIFNEEDVKSLDTMLTKGTVVFNWGNAWYGGTFFLANGGQLFGEKGNNASAGIQFGKNNGGYEAALKMVQLAAHPNMVTDNGGMGSAGLIEGSVGAYFSGSWEYEFLYSQLGDKLGVVQPPMVEIAGQQKQMKSFAGSKAVAVNSRSKNKDVAMEFAAFMASVQSQKLRYQLNGVIPAAQTLANDSEIRNDPVALAEINTMSNAAVVQPIIMEMANYWAPVGNFGGMVGTGEVNSSNYKEAVDYMMSNFDN